MPKAVQTLLRVVASILFGPSALAIAAFPMMLAIQFPTQATAHFLGLMLAGSGAVLIAKGLLAWLHSHPRTIYALVHPTPASWAGLALLAWGCLLCLFMWPPLFVAPLLGLSALLAGPLLLLGWVSPVIGQAIKSQRAQQALASAQPDEPVRRRTPPLFIVWAVLSVVIGYGLLLLTQNGQLSAWLNAYLSYQPPIGLLPEWLPAVFCGLAWSCIFLIRVPPSLRRQPPRQRFLFLLARKTFGGAALGYGILLTLEISHTLPYGATDPFLELILTLAAMAGLTYLAAWLVVWLIRRRAARQQEV